MQGNLNVVKENGRSANDNLERARGGWTVGGTEVGGGKTLELEHCTVYPASTTCSRTTLVAVVGVIFDMAYALTTD